MSTIHKEVDHVDVRVVSDDAAGVGCRVPAPRSGAARRCGVPGPLQRPNAGVLAVRSAPVLPVGQRCRPLSTVGQPTPRCRRLRHPAADQRLRSAARSAGGAPSENEAEYAGGTRPGTSHVWDLASSSADNDSVCQVAEPELGGPDDDGMWVGSAPTADHVRCVGGGVRQRVDRAGVAARSGAVPALAPRRRHDPGQRWAGVDRG